MLSVIKKEMQKDPGEFRRESGCLSGRKQRIFSQEATFGLDLEICE